MDDVTTWTWFRLWLARNLRRLWVWIDPGLVSGVSDLKLPGSGEQQARHYLYDASGTITTGGTAQLLIPQTLSRNYFFFQNNSVGPLWLEFGSARATCTITNGAVTSVSITNSGFNFTKPPVVRFLGGGYGANTAFLGAGQPGYPSPSNVATGHAVLSGSTLGSITIDNPGSGYAIAPYVLIFDSDLDPFGCAAPASGTGILLPSGGPPFILQASFCTTDPVAVWGATTGQQYVCRWSE